MRMFIECFMVAVEIMLFLALGVCVCIATLFTEAEAIIIPCVIVLLIYISWKIREKFFGKF